METGLYTGLDAHEETPIGTARNCSRAITRVYYVLQRNPNLFYTMLFRLITSSCSETGDVGESWKCFFFCDKLLGWEQ